MAPQLPKLQSVTLELRPSGVLSVVLNTPHNYNAFDTQKYDDITAALRFAEAQTDVKAVVLSANGKFFSSGAALSEERIKSITQGKPINIDSNDAKKYIDVLIDFPKLLVAAVQGPAYGIAVTTLPFFDLVYASREATFTTPFSTLAMCLEGCSSVTFPAILGPALASRLLYLSDTITLDEMARTGLIADVIPKEEIQRVVLERIEEKLEPISFNSIVASKSLVRSPEVRKHLKEVNKQEMLVLAQRVASDDHKEALFEFQRKREAKRAAKQSKL